MSETGVYKTWSIAVAKPAKRREWTSEAFKDRGTDGSGREKSKCKKGRRRGRNKASASDVFHAGGCFADCYRTGIYVCAVIEIVTVVSDV